MMKYALQNPENRAVTPFQKSFDGNYSFDQFLEVLFYREMKYFASDLLEKGLSPEDIQQAVKRAILIGKTAGLEIRRHFNPVYTQFQGALMKDCKLSRIGYALVLLNARADSRLVANWQMQILEHFFAGDNSTFSH